MGTHRIVILVSPDVEPFCVTAPIQVFRFVDTHYQVLACGVNKGDAFSTCGLRFVVEHGIEALEHADTVLVTGATTCDFEVDDAVIEAVQRAYRRGARIVSLCTGAFVLAKAGLLDGRSATTHWACAPYLARQYPHVRVDAGALYVDDGAVCTGAGVTASVDICLHLIRTDHGQATANRVAKLLVASPHRSGGQAQFIDSPVPTERSRSLAKTRQWLLEHLDGAIRVSDMAAHAGLAPRSFARRFEAEMGVTPVQWLIEQRVKHAQVLLETTAMSVDRVADVCGFGTAVSLRQHFKKMARVTPTDYRRNFSEGQP